MLYFFQQSLGRRIWSHKSWFPLKLPCIVCTHRLTDKMFALNSISFCTTLYDFYIWQIEMEGKGFHMKTMLEVSIWYYCDFFTKNKTQVLRPFRAGFPLPSAMFYFQSLMFIVGQELFNKWQMCLCKEFDCQCNGRMFGVPCQLVLELYWSMLCQNLNWIKLTMQSMQFFLDKSVLNIVNCFVH